MKVASATTAVGSWLNEEITRTITAISVASIGIARIAFERPESIAAAVPAARSRARCT